MLTRASTVKIWRLLRRRHQDSRIHLEVVSTRTCLMHQCAFSSTGEQVYLLGLEAIRRCSATLLRYNTFVEGMEVNLQRSRLLENTPSKINFPCADFLARELGYQFTLCRRSGVRLEKLSPEARCECGRPRLIWTFAIHRIFNTRVGIRHIASCRRR